MNQPTIVLLLSMALCSSAWANHDGAGEDGAKHARGDSDKYLEKLELTPEQGPKVSEIMNAQREKRHAIFKSDKEQSQKKAEMETLRAETRQQLSAVLSAEQMTRFDEMASNWKKHRKGGHHKRDAGTATEAADVPPAAPAQN